MNDLVLYNPKIDLILLWNRERRALNDQNYGYTVLNIDHLFDLGYEIIGIL